jgi:hypothetical protein
MKTLFLIIAATVALALSAVAQNVDCSLLTFVPNPDVALGGSKWLFCGWLWMKTKEVNALHKRPSL